jgi:hypothetical protein
MALASPTAFAAGALRTTVPGIDQAAASESNLRQDVRVVRRVYRRPVVVRRRVYGYRPYWAGAAPGYHYGGYPYAYSYGYPYNYGNYGYPAGYYGGPGFGFGASIFPSF